VLASIGYAVAYTAVGLALLALGYLALDLLTPGHLGRHIYEDRSVSAAVVLAAGFLAQGAVVFTTIWTNATSGFGRALLYTVVFGVLGVLLQAGAFLVLDLLTPGKLGQLVTEVAFHPASLVSAAAQLSVAAIIVASIWP
jgi:formate-dependent nitrite reductase membrane component NrfD